MVEVTGADYQHLLTHREDLDRPLFYIDNTRMYCVADEFRTWKATQAETEGGK